MTNSVTLPRSYIRIATTVQAGLLVFFAFIPHASAVETGSPASAVLDRHLQAFAARDIDAIMQDYSNQSVFITPSGVLKGEAEIRKLFETLVREFSSPETTVSIHQRYTQGPVAYIVWSAETAENLYELATDTLYVVDNRIRYQTFASKTTTK